MPLPFLAEVLIAKIGLESVKGLFKHLIGSKEALIKSEINIENLNITIGNGTAIENADALFDTNEFALFPENKIENILIPIAETLSKEDDIAILKGVLRDDDFKAVVLAFSSIRMCNNNNTEKERFFLSELTRIYPSKGRRIYNLIRGGYFNEFISDIKWERLVSRAEPIAIREKFISRFDKIIQHSDNAIFVGVKYDPLQLTMDINLRLESSNIVNIHYREPRKNIVEEAKSHVKVNLQKKGLIPEFNIIEDGTILERTAYILQVKKIFDVKSSTLYDFPTPDARIG